MFKLSLLALFFIFAVASAAFSATSLSKTNHFVKTPHQYTDKYIHVGGRFDERRLSYIANSGYSSFVSIVNYATNDTIHNDVPGSYPSTDYELQIMGGYGLKTGQVTASFNVESTLQISSLLDTLPSPIFIHCHAGFMASLFTNIHYFYKNKIDAEQIYSNGIELGFDYQSNADVVSLINQISNRNDEVTPEKLEKPLAQGETSYKYYFWTHRTGGSDYWYNLGQPLSTQVQAIVNAGYKTVISFRLDGEATVRLSTDPATGPIDNDEFSDENGNYSAEAERKAIESAGLVFEFIPVNGSSPETAYTVENFKAMYPTLKKANKRGPVLAHCASGMRALVFELAFIASEEKKCTAWAIEAAKEVGFDWSQDQNINKFYSDLLHC